MSKALAVIAGVGPGTVCSKTIPSLPVAAVLD